MTLAGVILGTAAYMSPEQAKGKPVDKRADIWAFGCVLYEMLAGRRAFDAEDVSETLAAVLMKEPDWTALPATTPATVMIVLRRCLQKDRKRRVRDIGDVSLALDGAFETPVSQVPAVAVKPTWRRGLSFAGLAVLAGALLTAGAWGLSRATPQLPVDAVHDRHAGGQIARAILPAKPGACHPTALASCIPPTAGCSVGHWESSRRERSPERKGT